MKGFLFFFFILTFTLSCSKKHDVEKPSVKAILSFSFLKADNAGLSKDVSGRVSHDSILVDVPPGTVITSLVPSITIQGATIQPANKVAQNFTGTVIYTVTAEDGSSRAFKVVVHVLDGLKEITSFIFKKADNPGLADDIVGVITGDTIELGTLPGVNISSLVPTIIYKGVQLSPESGYTNNFDYPATYTVTADDKTTRSYMVFAGANRNVYTVGSDGYLYALNALNGAMRWRYFVGGTGAPAVDNGLVFVEGASHVVYAINTIDGSLKWTSTPPQGSYSLGMPVAKYGKVYFSGSGLMGAPGDVAHYYGFVLSLNEQTGNQDWMSSLFTGYGYNDSRITNVTVEQNLVYAYDIMNGLFVFNAVDGSAAWGWPGDMLGRTNPVVSNGVVYYGVEGGIRAVNAANGQQQWLVHNNLVYASPTIANNALYTTVGSTLFAFDLNGGITWTSNYGGVQLYAPFVYQNTIYTYNAENKFIAFSADNGAEKWRKDNFSHYPVVCNNSIFISDASNRLNCLDAATGNLKWVNANMNFPNPVCVVDINGDGYYITEAGGRN